MRVMFLGSVLPTVALTATALLATGCGQTTPHEGIEISNARINPPLPGQNIAVGFMDIANHGANHGAANHGGTDRLIGVSSPSSNRIELHTHIQEDGIMKMRRVEGIDLPLSRRVHLEPGGYHIMIFNADATDEMLLTLDFKEADDVTLSVPVIPREAASRSHHHSDNHSGH